uniref:MULE transposase domain-containing protein n=1 Tax=Aegilops tauschii subsp. strangulata TaxID=200361 RepID=A0A453N7U3_AEGTS
MYPVAWAVVEKETTETWKWFIGLLIKDLDINDQGAGWVFISDQQKFICQGHNTGCVQGIFMPIEERS